MTLQLSTAASGVARSAHYVIPTGQTVPIQTLLLEPQRTNLALRSEEANDAVWVKTDITVTPNAINAPDGTMTADLETEGTAGTSLESQSVTVTSGAIAVYSRYLKRGNTDWMLFRIAAGSSTSGNFVTAWFNLGTGAIGTSSAAGTSVLAGAGIQALSNGWYRVWVAGSTPATTTYIANMRATASDGSVTRVNNATYYVWGAQVEAATVPSSYIKTEGTTITRNADSLFFPYTASPQAMTVYVRTVDFGSAIGTTNGQHILSIGRNTAGGSPPPAGMQLLVSGAIANAAFADGIGGSRVSTQFLTGLTIGDIAEYRVTLSATGVIQCAFTRNNGTELVGAASATLALPAAWNVNRLWLTAIAATGQQPMQYTNVVVAVGQQSRDTMRQLAGVV